MELEKETDTMKQFYKYDVAFSFLEKDEKIAVEISQLVEGRIGTFLYARKQGEIVGKDGEEEFNRVFGLEARLVVVLYDAEWGKTSWTRIEETAIRNRGYSEGYDFVLFIITKTGLQPPKWLPKNRLWFGLGHYGVKGAAAVIEARVQELEGEVRELTAADKAKQKAREIEFEHTRQDFLRSQDGMHAACKEVANLFSELKKIITQIESQNLKFTIDGNDKELMVYSSGYTLFIHWSVQYANSLDSSCLRVQLFKGVIPYKGRMPFEDPERLAEESYYFDVLMSEQYVWRFRKFEGEFFLTDQLVSMCIEKLMDRIKKAKVMGEK